MGGGVLGPCYEQSWDPLSSQEAVGDTPVCSNPHNSPWHVCLHVTGEGGRGGREGVAHGLRGKGKGLALSYGASCPHPCPCLPASERGSRHLGTVGSARAAPALCATGPSIPTITPLMS